MTKTEQKKQKKKLQQLQQSRGQLIHMSASWCCGAALALLLYGALHMASEHEDVPKEPLGVGIGMMVPAFACGAMAAVRDLQIDRVRKKMQKQK